VLSVFFSTCVFLFFLQLCWFYFHLHILFKISFDVISKIHKAKFMRFQAVSVVLSTKRDAFYLSSAVVSSQSRALSFTGALPALWSELCYCVNV